MVLFRKVAFPLQSTLGPPMSTRLEPQSVSGDPATGLRAEVWDPLWLLARQWQLGELAGEDTGTPLTVRVLATAEPLVAWRPGPSTDADWRPLPPGIALEELVLAETSSSPSARELALAGWSLLETLEDLGEDGAARALHDRFGAPPAAIPAASPHTALVPDTWSPLGACLSRRALDLAAVLEAFEAQPDRPGWWRTSLRAGVAGQARAEASLAHWLAWVRAEVLPENTHDGSWVGPRLEHQFALATPTRVLTAPAHPGGDVSWSTVDLEPAGGIAVPPPSDAASRSLDRTLVATPLQFPGMPASRFWELEDGRVDLGSVWADPHELARLLVVECALVHGGDWLVVPVDVPCGCVVTLDEVTYNDTFGTTWVVDTSGADTSRWRMFAVTESAHRQAGLEGLLVTPASASTLRGGPVEDVGFLRDESANLVWAVEHLVAGPGGDPVMPMSGPPARRTPPTPQGAETVLGYELMTEVPQTWTPYLPRVRSVEEGLDTAVALVRGHVRRYDERGDPADVEPAGTLLRGEEHRWLESAEVPREGVRIQRSPVLCRRGDGSWASWIERRVLVGRGEAESGLRSDLAVRP
ncbi:MAG: hypothetical protein ABI181_09715 [Mycobacteriaceae bacterium]